MESQLFYLAEVGLFFDGRITVDRRRRNRESENAPVFFTEKRGTKRAVPPVPLSMGRETGRSGMEDKENAGGNERVVPFVPKPSGFYFLVSRIAVSDDTEAVPEQNGPDAEGILLCETDCLML